MDRRWAPTAAAASVVALVVTVTLVVAARDGDPPTDSALRPPPASEPATPGPVASPSAEPSKGTTTATPPAQVAPTPGSASAPATEPRPPDRSPAAPPATTSPAPAPAPRSPLPPPASSPPGAARAAFSFDAAYGTDEPYEVVVQYGDSSSCPHENVRYAVRETADRVVVTLEADAMSPERACTADYRQMLVPIRLAQPMGDRVLVDGSRGEPVPVDRSCQRVFADPPPPKDCEP